MEKSKIIKKLIQIVCKETGINDASIHQDTQLIGGGVNLTSMKILKLIISIEKHFGIQFQPDVFTENYFDNITTLSELISQIIEAETSTMV